jgi:hypothetical protein
MPIPELPGKHFFLTPIKLKLKKEQIKVDKRVLGQGLT